MVEPVPIQRSNVTEGNLVNFDDATVSNGDFNRQQSSFHVSGNDQLSALRRFHSLRTDIQNKIVRSFNVSYLLEILGTRQSSHTL
jgi:hypothetical protein